MIAVITNGPLTTSFPEIRRRGQRRLDARENHEVIKRRKASASLPAFQYSAPGQFFEIAKSSYVVETRKINCAAWKNITFQVVVMSNQRNPFPPARMTKHRLRLVILGKSGVDAPLVLDRMDRAIAFSLFRGGKGGGIAYLKSRAPRE